jgi:predicted unusual protein kinase regulating ubiquinone biosynthesis (AarF/ABC1/UbiB family)
MGVRTKIGRFFKLGGMTASVASHYLGARLAGSLSSQESKTRRIRRTHERVGKILAQTLGDLKGPVMKVGQMASISTGLLPIEISSALAVLRRSVPFAPYDIIARQIERELGEPPEALFRTFEREPFAAASIGQVHRAVTDDGREVVVKVQYPEVSASVDADLAQLRLALRAAGVMKDRREHFDKFFKEFAAQLREELDYCLEADHVRIMADFHRGRHPFLHVPEVVSERSSGRVLTLTFEGGASLEESASFPQPVRDQIGERLVRRVYAEILDLGVLHADPNPANFGFRQDGTLALYDFGCVRRFTDDERQGLRAILGGVLTRDCDAIEQGLVTAGVRNPDGPAIDPALYGYLLDVLSPALDGVAPFDMGGAMLHRQFVSLIPKMRRHTRSFNITAGMMLVQRVNVGTYGNLRKLGARVPLRQILREALDASN